MSGRTFVALVWLVAIAAVWILPSLFAASLEPVFAETIGWIQRTLGLPGLIVFLIGAPAIAWTVAYRLHRREQARQFALNRTIDVPKRLPPRTLTSKITIAVVLALLAVLVITGLWPMGK